MVYHGICKYRAVHGGISRYMQSVFHGLCKYIAVQSGICQYEILSIQVHTGTYWYMRVHPRLTCFVPGCCSTLLARVKAAELQRPKDTLVQTETILLISSGIFLAPARRRHLLGRRRRLGQRRGGRGRHCRRQAGDGVAAATTAKDGDVVGGDKFAFESRARAPSILRMPS